MNARTLIITAGAVVALAAPAVASAKLSPAWQYQKNLAAKQHAVKHAKHVVKRPGRSQIYTYYPAPASQPAKSLQEQEAAYNADLVAHGLDPVEFPDTSTAPAATSDESSSTSAPGETSSTSTSDSTPAAASFAAAPATTIAAVDDSDDC